MKRNNFFLIASLCGVALLTSGCSHDPDGPHKRHDYNEYGKHQHKKYHKTTVFQQKYEGGDIDDVYGKIYTRSVRGGESEMGYIKFKETEDGLKMKVDLIDLRPGQTYTAHIYQCGDCNDGTCCDTSPMNIDLPLIQTNTGTRLQQSYIIRGLTATQLNNAKIVLTRDGGYKAAWGTLRQ